MLPGNVQTTADGHAWEHGFPARWELPQQTKGGFQFHLTQWYSQCWWWGAMQQGDYFWFVFPAPSQDQQCTFPAFFWVLQEGADGWMGSLQPCSPGRWRMLYLQITAPFPKELVCSQAPTIMSPLFSKPWRDGTLDRRGMKCIFLDQKMGGLERALEDLVMWRKEL